MIRPQKPAARSVLMIADYRNGTAVEAALSERWRIQRVHRIEEAVWRLRSGRFAALILGLSLSEESGQVALEEVVRAYPEIPVVVLLEPGAEADAAWALSRGAAGYVPAGPALAVLLEPVLEQALLSTRLRKAESDARELEYRDQLRALALSIRHEINNPLTGILGSAEMALKTPELPPAMVRRLTNIVKLTEEIRSLLQELEAVPDKTSRLWQPAE